MNLRQVSSFMRKIPVLLRLTLWLLLVVPFASIRAQSIDPMNETVAVHVHPQDAIVGVTNGIVFATYTLDFQFIEEFTLLGDPSIQPIQYNFHWSPNGNKLAVLLYGVSVPPVDTVLQIWDITTPQKLYEIPGADLFVGVAWSPDGTRFASLIRNDELQTFVQVYTAITGQMLVEIPSPPITQLAWSPSGNQLVFETIADVKIYSADTGQLLHTLNAKMDSELELAFSPTQNLVAFVNLNTGDNVIEIWNTDTGQFVRQLSGHTKRIIHFEWTTGGLVSTGFDDTIRIWDPQTGQQIRSFQMGRYPYAQLNANGTVLLVQDQATGIHTRDAETGAILAVFGETIPENGPIVYVSKRTGNWDVYKMNPDGSDDTNLTSNYTGKDWAPSWSPDGTQIVFESLRHHASGEIYSMNADGSNVTRLTNNTFLDTEPDYSPDGSQIVFVSARNGTDDEIWVMNADGSGQTLLYDSPGDDNLPVWSPDGTKVAFCSDQSGNWEIYVMPSTGGTATNLTNHSSMDRNPAWSPDGSQIAWVSNRSFVDIYAMPATGGTATNLSNHSDYDSYPSYSPDGTLMTFTSNRDGDQEVWTMTVTGASPVQLTFNTAIEWYPDWVALTAGNEALLSAPAVIEAAIPDNTPRPGRLNALPRGKSEQTHANLFYVGVWVDETVAGTSVRTTHSIGGEVWFAFRGRQVILHVVTRPDALPIEVCIDDVCQTIDLYSAQAILTSITLGDLSAGTHTVHIRNDSAGYLSLDAIEVPEKS